MDTVQIAFLTLFLGLVSGPQTVQVAVSGPAAVVEIALDGRAVCRLHGAPWKARIDLGAALVPHELVARALDAQGKELARTRQLVNLPRPPAEVEVLLEGDGKARAAAARLTWHSLTGEAPAEVRVLFDGRPLSINTAGRVALPAYDPGAAHILSAELRFSAAIAARRDVVFGGRYGSEVSTELTAVPVRLRPGQRLPAIGQLQGWFMADGRPAAVAAVEEGPAQLLVVRDRGARDLLVKLDQRSARSALPSAGLGLRRTPSGTLADPQSRRFAMTLGKDEQVRFLWPIARSFAGSGLPAELFDTSRDYTAQDGGLLWLLGRALPQTDAGEQRLADAVAVAALQALAGNHRRAVLLVLGDAPEDASRYDAGTVRRYLEAVRVPLAVWAPGDLKAAATPKTAAWGTVRDVSAPRKLSSEFDRLRDDLAAQRIVWLEGSHLPTAVALAPGAAATIELVKP